MNQHRSLRSRARYTYFPSCDPDQPLGPPHHGPGHVSRGGRSRGGGARAGARPCVCVDVHACAGAPCTNCASVGVLAGLASPSTAPCSPWRPWQAASVAALIPSTSTRVLTRAAPSHACIHRFWHARVSLGVGFMWPGVAHGRQCAQLEEPLTVLFFGGVVGLAGPAFVTMPVVTSKLGPRQQCFMSPTQCPPKRAEPELA